MNYILRAGLILVLLNSCKKSEQIENKTTKEEIPIFDPIGVDEVKKIPYNFIKEEEAFSSIFNSTAEKYLDSTIIDENRRLFATMDSLNDLMTLKGDYGSLNTTYDEFYWYEETNVYKCMGSRYERNKLFLHWPKFNILSYAKEDMDRDIFTSPLYLASHDKNTGEMIDRISFDFYGLFDGIEKGTSSLTVYTDSIVGVINHKKSTYLISPEGKLTLK